MMVGLLCICWIIQVGLFLFHSIFSPPLSSSSSLSSSSLSLWTQFQQQAERSINWKQYQHPPQQQEQQQQGRKELPQQEQEQQSPDNSLRSSSSSSSSTLLTTSSSFMKPPSPQELLESLPQWIQTYVKWHNEMRNQFPGKDLLEHPQGPKILIRTCLGLCGGLHDRLGQLPWDLYLANITQRVLLLHWHRPVPLEYFLVPNNNSHDDDNENENKIVLDWRVPKDVAGFFPRNTNTNNNNNNNNIGHKIQQQQQTTTSTTTTTTTREEMRIVRNGYRDLFQGYNADHPTQEFWENELPQALHRAIYGSFTNDRVLRHRLLGHLGESILEERLQQTFSTNNNNIQQQQEQQQSSQSSLQQSSSQSQQSQSSQTTTNNIDDWRVHSPPIFGRIFHLFFQPSPAVQQELDRVLVHELNLTTTTSTTTNNNNHNNKKNRKQQQQKQQQQVPIYDGVHCRVRHPKATPKQVLVLGKNEDYPADKTGLPWIGETRAFAIATATHALKCAQLLQQQEQGIQESVPIYFFRIRMTWLHFLHMTCKIWNIETNTN